MRINQDNVRFTNLIFKTGITLGDCFDSIEWTSVSKVFFGLLMSSMTSSMTGNSIIEAADTFSRYVEMRILNRYLEYQYLVGTLDTGHFFPRPAFLRHTQRSRIQKLGLF